MPHPVNPDSRQARPKKPNHFKQPEISSSSNPLTTPAAEMLAPGSTVAQAKELWSEVMFYLALGFGLLHFAGLAMQVAGMFMHTTLKTEPGWSFTSSLLMGNLYLAFLTAYVGGKEFLRWFKRKDDAVISDTEARKITRGVWIVIIWSAFTAVVVFGWQLGLIGEVPNALLYTLGEVVTLFCGTEVSKYIRNQQALESKQASQDKAEYADQVKAYCQEKGSISNKECQEELGLSQDQASRLLSRMVKDKVLKAEGETWARRYVLG